MEFLRQVAQHYFKDADGLCFIFPNRRSQVFFRKYFGDEVKAAGTPAMAPMMLTINDFFYKVAGVGKADRVRLLLELYDCYRNLYSNPETLDEFIFWGDILLGDFDDVDKYLVDPKMLFANVKDFRDLQDDDYGYLSDTQLAAIRQFMGHFKEEDRRPADSASSDQDGMKVKDSFLKVWQILFPLYSDFRKSLKNKGISYEGMVYRDLAERLTGKPQEGTGESASDVLSEVFPKIRKYVFVGLNALNECEKAVMRKMRDAGLAEFCWDYSSSFIMNTHNKSSLFLSENIKEFPQAFRPDPEGLQLPKFEVISVPSSVGQAKLLPDLLSEAKGSESDDYSDCAVVLPDESLLIPVLNSIPPEVRDINVTMGYPMKSSAFYDFLSTVDAMQLHLRNKDGKWYFYHTQVWAVFSSSIFGKLIAGDETAAARVGEIKQNARYYIPQEDLSGIPAFDLIFRPAVKDQTARDRSQIEEIEEYQLSLISGIAKLLVGNLDLSMEVEFAKAAYNAVNQLKANELEILPLTYFRLYEQLISPVTVPFNGEPLKGLQIMGPLETRTLDFRHIFLLSCNEGIFPHRSVSSSFIPPELRKGFGLPTYELQDAVWAYYFYRMIQRADTVTLIYDSRTEGLKVGEESRYIKQLEYHFGVNLKRSFVKAKAKIHNEITDLPKKPEDIAELYKIRLSASSIRNYLDCPAMFYFGSIQKLSEVAEVTEDVDAPTIGNIFHATMQALYMGEPAMDPNYDVLDKDLNKAFQGRLTEITKSYIESWLKRSKDIQARIRSLIISSLHTFEVKGGDLVTEKVILEYVLRTLKRDAELMDKHGVDSFKILGTEQKVTTEIDDIKFVGYVDRLDSFHPGEVRIVDYKTGKVEKAETDINDGNANEVAEALFAPDNEKRPGIAFQIFIYDYMVQHMKEYGGCSIVNSIYQPMALFSNAVNEVPMSHEFNRLAEEKLHLTLAEMKDPDIGWRRTTIAKICQRCSFKDICGR